MTIWKESYNLDELMTEYPNETDIIVLDTETTGICIHDYDLHRDNYILQLSIISANTDRTLFDRYFRPRIKSWPDAERVNHISPNMVMNCQSIARSRREIQSIIDNAKVIIGYNVDFDLSFLVKSGISTPENAVLIDVMEDYAVYHGAYNRYFHSYTWQKLTTASKFTGYDWSQHKGAHNSLGDCYATLHVCKFLQAKYNKGYRPTYPEDYGEEPGC